MGVETACGVFRLAVVVVILAALDRLLTREIPHAARRPAIEMRHLPAATDCQVQYGGKRCCKGDSGTHGRIILCDFLVIGPVRRPRQAFLLAPRVSPHFTPLSSTASHFAILGERLRAGACDRTDRPLIPRKKRPRCVSTPAASGACLASLAISARRRPVDDSGFLCRAAGLTLAPAE